MKRVTDSQKVLQLISAKREFKKTLKDNESDEFVVENKKNNQRFKIEKLEHFQRILVDQPIRKTISKTKGRDITISVPKDFRFYENPETVLKLIGKVSRIKNKANVRSLCIDHSNCESHDLAAEVLLASAVTGLKAFKCKDGAKFRIQGLYPQCERMRRLMRSIGIVKETASPKYHLTSTKEDNLRIYKRQSIINEKINIFGKDKKTRATEDFVSHLNECLSLIKAKLDPDEIEKIDKYLGEVLGNAEDHSGTKIWNIVGYCDALDDKQLYSEIVITSVGKSIFETFEEKKSVPVVYAELDKYIKRHHLNISAEQLTTIFAMQQNVSSKRDESITRGQGTKYLIDLFQHLSSECNKINEIRGYNRAKGKPKMILASGSTCLIFDDRFNLSAGDNSRLVYALNEKNDLNEPPDSNFLLKLSKVIYPGTLISIRFPLYEEILNLNDKDDGQNVD